MLVAYNSDWNAMEPLTLPRNSPGYSSLAVIYFHSEHIICVKKIFICVFRCWKITRKRYHKPILNFLLGFVLLLNLVNQARIKTLMSSWISLNNGHFSCFWDLHHKLFFFWFSLFKLNWFVCWVIKWYITCGWPSPMTTLLYWGI